MAGGAHGRQSWTNSEKPSKITVPTRGNPLARLVFAEMQKQGVTYAELEWRASVLVSTVKSWRNEKAPSLPSIEATLGALGWALVPVPCTDRVPEWVRNELDGINERWGREEPLLHRLLASACLAPILVDQPGAPTPTTIDAVPTFVRTRRKARASGPSPFQSILFEDKTR